MKNKIILNYDEYIALCTVVDYLHDDELKHYEEETQEGEFINKHHIWHSVKTLSLKLKEYQMKE
mgnify:CR=1 FL=1|tara:strand:- start:1645 stop:1836 length:192 start_codon:yes stop_codon:yes gene_type:complete